jgi:hypothetical protein
MMAASMPDIDADSIHSDQFNSPTLMKIPYCLALVALCLVMTNAYAQDTCTVYKIPNPHGAAMSVTRVWVVDTVNFSVESVYPLPVEMTATSTFDVNVCILARDGQSHSTIVRYTNTHGTSSYPVTMTAPATSGVESSGGQSVSLRLALPNPAGSTVSIDPGFTPTDDLRVGIVDLSGRRVVGDLRPSFSSGRLVIDVSSITSGRYLVLLDSPGRPVAAWPIVVQH